MLSQKSESAIQALAPLLDNFSGTKHKARWQTHAFLHVKQLCFAIIAWMVFDKFARDADTGYPNPRT